MFNDVIDQLLNTSKVVRLEDNLHTQVGLSQIPFQKRYINMREAENRIYTLDQLRTLPDVPKTNPHHHEWKIRSRTAKNLRNYLHDKKAITSILEIGCGNGWLSNQIAATTDYTVVGLDVNQVELKQAAEAFKGTPTVHFVFGNIVDDIFVRNSFDIVILAAAIQYFENLPNLVNHIFPLLKERGEIHILDSPFYRTALLPQARKRSAQYFASIGHVEMEKHYFHHSLDELKALHIEVMYDPGAIKNRVLRKWLVKDLSPFPWIRISNKVL